MVKVTDAIDTIIRENLLYSLIINSGLANYTSLAKKIRDRVEFVTGKEVKINTIVKTLTGIKTTDKETRVIDILKKSNLSVEYQYTEALCDKVQDISDDVMLVVKEGHMYRCILKSGGKNDLALIRIILPQESAGEPGITLLVTEYLNIFRLTVKNIYRLDTEIWLTVDVNHAGEITDRISRLLYNSYM